MEFGIEGQRIKGYSTDLDCVTRFAELLSKDADHAEVLARIARHELASADLQAVGVGIVRGFEVAPSLPEAMNILRCALEIAWGLGYKAAQVDVQRQDMAQWQVAN